MKRTILQVSPLPGFEPEIGRLVWCMEDVRRILLKKLSGISQAVLDSKSDHTHSVGTLLYHIAFVEAGWLYGEVMEKEWDPEIASLFPMESWTDGKLNHFEGESFQKHVERLTKVREVFLAHFRSMDLEDWRRLRSFDEYDVTPEWVVYHLIEHEANHRGQIFQMVRELRAKEKNFLT